MSKHRAQPAPRIRYGRVAAATASLMVTAVALLGGIGIIPLGQGDAALAGSGTRDPATDVRGLGAPQDSTPTPSGPSSTPTTTPPATADTSGTSTRQAPSSALPSGTGTGRRVVFSESNQRVWLVSAKNTVIRSYPVSGSVTDNLKPGSYQVYSRSRWAVGIEDSGVMQYFVRFTRGDNAAIGFHSIPTKNGKALQTVAQLGTPQSHGCIRQKLTDAERMWNFAPVGTRVVVV